MAIGNGVVIRFLADTSRAVRDIGRLEKATGKAVTTGDKARAVWAKAGPALAGVATAAGAAVFALGVQGVKAAKEDEDAQAKLARALKNTTDATDDQVAAMEDYVSIAQEKTGLDDQDLRKGLSTLLRFTKNAQRAQALNNVAMKVSLATGKDYLSVVTALGKAEDGNTASLKRLGIPLGEQAQNYLAAAKASKAYSDAQAFAAQVLKDYGPKSDEYAAALKRVKDAEDKLNRVKGGGTKWLAELNDQFTGAITDDALSYAGGIRRVGTAWSELLEAFGTGATSGSAGGQMSDLAQAMYDAQPAAQSLGETLSNTLVPGMRDFVVGLAGIGPLWDTFVQTISGGITSVNDFLGVIPDDQAQSMQDYYAKQIARNNAALQEIAGGREAPTVNPYDLYRPMDVAQRYNTSVKGADTRAAQRSARTRQRP